MGWLSDLTDFGVNTFINPMYGSTQAAIDNPAQAAAVTLGAPTVTGALGGYSGSSGVNIDMSGIGSAISGLGGVFSDAFTGFGGIVKDALGAVQPYQNLVSGLTTALGGYEGQRLANEGNVALANNQNIFNAGQADINRQFQSAQVQRQMDFQERMSGTSYQRAVQDMKSAGLNPMLAYTQGGASSPSGGAASGGAASSVATPRLVNAIGPALQSAFQVASASQQIEQAKANVRRTDAETTVLEASVPKVKAETEGSLASAMQARTQSMYLQDQMRVAQAEVTRLVDQARLIRSETERSRFEVEKLLPAQLRLLHLEVALTSNQVPASQNAASFANTWWGRNVSPALTDVVKSIGAGAAAAGGAGALGLRLPSRHISERSFSR